MENDKLIRRTQVLDLIGLSHTTQWRMERAGKFPARVKLGSWSVRWHLAEVEEWVRGRERVPGGKVSEGSGEVDR
jgi:prophage regulatory protein